MSYPPPPPLPIAPLNYDMPLHRSRPGIITAMGVMSIVVACISGLFALWSGALAVGFFAMSRMPRAVFMPPTPVTMPANVQAGSVTVGGIETGPEDSEDGLPEPQRRLIVASLAGISQMDAQRQKHLDLLLSISGRKVFPFASNGVTPQRIRTDVTETGLLPSAGGGKGPDYFIVGTGRLETYDDHAVFRPDGSNEVVSASASGDDSNSTIPPGNTPVRTGGSKRGRIMLGPGRVSVTPGAPLMPRFSSSVAAVSMGVSLVSVALAIYLLVIGIVTLRDSRAASRLHWIYVIIKIPLVIVGVMASWQMFSGLVTSVSPTAAAVPQGAMLFWFLVLGALALAYPVALIFVLISRPAREYYGAAREQ